MVTGRFISARARISPLAHVHDRVRIEDDVTVEPFCTVGDDVTIARGSVIRSGARLVGRVALGEACVVGENAVVGGEGFGIDQDEEGHNLRVPQLGGVILGTRVEIGALSTVCAGTLGPTVLGDHVKIDDRVHVAHNARLGRQCVVTAGTVIGGSVSMGDEGWVGLGATIRDAVTIGEACLIGQGTVVEEDLPDHTIVAARPSPSQVAPAATVRALLWASQRRNEE
jgi:UDP-3-O-[3-hydroxymyristoyl] glucosamine N-acyltransferase LpxD